MDKRFFWDGRVTTLELAVDDALKGEQSFTFSTAYSRLKNQVRYTALFKKAFGRPGDITEANIHKAIAQFLRSITSIESKYDLSLKGQYTLTPDEIAGKDMFMTEKADCFHCHADGPFQTFANQIQLFANNGLDSVSSTNDFKDFGLGGFTKNQFDNGRFKIPTLRNIEKSAPYMHDARFKTLEEVVDFYSSGVKRGSTTDPLMTHAGQGGIQLNSTEKMQLIAFLKTLTDVGFETNPAYSNPF
jgi:cytochrome c peroxidase